MVQRSVSDAASRNQRRQSQSVSNSPCVVTAHNELLESSIARQLGPLAEFLVRTLNRCGPLTLKELADTLKRESFNNPLRSGNDGETDATKHTRSPIELPVTVGADVAADAAIKEVVTRLLLHRVVRYDAESQTYSVSLGYGLFLRTLFPLVVQLFHRRYGEAGVTILMVYYQLAVIPLEQALRLAIERRPTLSEALRRCAQEMEVLGLVEPLHAPLAKETHAPTEAPSRQSTTTANSLALPSLDPCQLHVGNILAEMLREAIHRQLLMERFADASGNSSSVAVGIVDCFTKATRTRHLKERLDGFPPMHPRVSPPVSLRALLCEVPHDEQAVLETLSRMCRSDGDFLVCSDGSASSGSMDGSFSFQYHSAVEAMRRDCCERFVFARHGVLGLRLIKLLLQHHNMEDRMLAEEAIATLPRTREVLHAMMRDGYVRQQEVPKTGTLADRLPKNSVFLWSCNLHRELLPTIRVQVATALRMTLARLRIEREEGANSAQPATSPLGIVAAHSSVSGVNSQGAKVNDGVNYPILALESSASALMEMMLVLDFF
ncbi:hypothetical protein ERJ75_001408300 [Trypanosoma vivax]|uniref:DNA-directed RNA polymerase III subunit RPC3 n=1 Tax=Trypanosoma vivax (strain Y486) TaxID=1055687 RepID=G0TRT1_TRYVY|nr:hypothetical protein TRVL_06178 [Trypanosoma vivax]KAH8607501.1 hypothetical protein ERJ75_001408300 [Trypanosoma vivax]CCC46653.1 conserved hypothetical protein [Trypanosoma vivax Y486]